MGEQDHTCPFCGEMDFDKPGLAHHIRMYCAEADAAWEAFVSYDAADKLAALHVEA